MPRSTRLHLRISRDQSPLGWVVWDSPGRWIMVGMVINRSSAYEYTHMTMSVLEWVLAPISKDGPGLGLDIRTVSSSHPDTIDTDSKVQIYHKLESENVDFCHLGFWEVWNIPLEIWVEHFAPLQVCHSNNLEIWGWLPWICITNINKVFNTHQNS